MSVFTFNLHSFHIHIVNDDLHCITILFFKRWPSFLLKKCIFCRFFLVHTYSGHGSKQNGQITSLQ